jgi:CheY-like chemotaxis protein
MSSIGENVRILVIDDEEIVHASLKKILTRVGYDIQSAFSAKDGLKQLDQVQYNLIIVDLMMPEMNGIQFLEALRERTSRPPVLMITGYPTISTAVQALRLGAVDYIAKPFTRKELLSPVHRALSLPEEENSIPLTACEHPEISKDQLVPGSICTLPRHAWAAFQQDGTFLIGVEKSFLNLCEKVVSISIPDEMDLIEQGYIGIYLKNEAGQDHGVAMPLSGQVIATNQDVLDNPLLLGSESWLIRIVPSHLEDELGRLVVSLHPEKTQQG